jgi:drug/metabolite transporter (DMT)-like permease
VHSNWKLGLGFTLLTVLMWGMLPVALKVVLVVMDPVTISWYRFSLSALIALLWYGHKRLAEVKTLLAGPSWRLTAVAVGGLLCNYLLYIWGLDHITPGAAQILIQLAPLLLLVGSVLLFKEGFSAAQWLGVATLCAGMLLFFHQRLTNLVSTSDDYVTGIALIIGAAVTWAFYGLAQKRLMATHNAQDLLFLICVAGTVLLLPLSAPLQIRALDATELACSAAHRAAADAVDHRGAGSLAADGHTHRAAGLAQQPRRADGGGWRCRRGAAAAVTT